jgi:hypothetical protein
MSEADSSRPAEPPPAVFAPPPAPPTRHPYAIASLILGILGFCGWSVLVAPVLGIVALVQIPRRNQTGRGMAIAGIVLSVLWVGVLAAAFVVYAGFSQAGGTAPTGQALKPGECYLKQETEGADITKASCMKPHDGQAFATFTLTPSTKAPSDGELEQAADAGCSTRSDEYFGSGAEPDGGDVVIFYPSGADWTVGRHTAVCAVQARGGQYVTPYER